MKPTIGELLIYKFMHSYEIEIKDKELCARNSFVCGMMAIVDAHNTIVKELQSDKQRAAQKIEELNKDVERLFNNI